jgi:hypothetical protein
MSQRCRSIDHSWNFCLNQPEKGDDGTSGPTRALWKNR